MRLIVRVAAIAAALFAAVLATAVVLVYFNQHRLVVAVLASVKQQTGIEIIPASSHLHVRNHLIVELDRPRVMSGNREIVSLHILAQTPVARVHNWQWPRWPEWLPATLVREPDPH